MALLDGDLKAEIGTNADILSIMLAGTLTHFSEALSNGRFVRSPTDYDVLGFLDTRRIAVQVGGAGPITGSSERVAILLGEGLAVVPKDGDTLTLQGQTMTVKTCEIDPAGATYTLTLREVGE